MRTIASSASLRLINLLLAGILAGNEFATWSVIHPALSQLPKSAHIQAEQELVRRYGLMMPFLMTATIVSAIPLLSFSRDRRSASFRFTLAGMLCFMVMLGITLLATCPLTCALSNSLLTKFP